MKNKENKICLYAHVETEPYGAELCCYKNGGGYCMFNRRDPNIDYSKCSNARIVYPETWAKHWKYGKFKRNPK